MGWITCRGTRHAAEVRERIDPNVMEFPERRKPALRYRSGLLVVAIIATSISCVPPPNSSVQPTQRANGGQSAPRLTDDKELLRLVEVYAGSGEDSNGAWDKLNSYPRQDLVNHLLKVRSSLPTDDYHRALIAFVLCNLNYDYENNRKIILDSFTDTAVYKTPFADWAGNLIDRLIERGDHELLPTLFKATGWADGALAASLSGYLTKYLKRDPSMFLSKLAAEPTLTRRGVYQRILNDELLTEEDKAQIKVYLKSIPPGSPMKRVADEMYTALSVNYEEERRPAQ
jgi:hypothetical protein